MLQINDGGIFIDLIDSDDCIVTRKSNKFKKRKISKNNCVSCPTLDPSASTIGATLVCKQNGQLCIQL